MSRQVDVRTTLMHESRRLCSLRMERAGGLSASLALFTLLFVHCHRSSSRVSLADASFSDSSLADCAFTYFFLSLC